jgi:hypothetical protein
MQYSIFQQFVIQHSILYLLNVYFRKDHALNLVAYPTPAFYCEEGERLPQVTMPANVKEFLEKPHDALKAVFFLGLNEPEGMFSAFPKAHIRVREWFDNVTRLGLNLDEDYDVNGQDIEGVRHLGPGNVRRIGAKSRGMAFLHPLMPTCREGGTIASVHTLELSPLLVKTDEDEQRTKIPELGSMAAIETMWRNLVSSGIDITGTVDPRGKLSTAFPAAVRLLPVNNIGSALVLNSSWNDPATITELRKCLTGDVRESVTNGCPSRLFSEFEAHSTRKRTRHHDQDIHSKFDTITNAVSQLKQVADHTLEETKAAIKDITKMVHDLHRRRLDPGWP